MTERDEPRVNNTLQGADFPASGEALLAYSREQVHDRSKSLHAPDATPEGGYRSKDNVIWAVPQEPEGEDAAGGETRG